MIISLDIRLLTHLIERGILNNSMSVFMHISCTTDNLQFKNTDYLEGEKKPLDDDPSVQITFRKQRAEAGQRGGGGGGRKGAVGWGRTRGVRAGCELPCVTLRLCPGAVAATVTLSAGVTPRPSLPASVPEHTPGTGAGAAAVQCLQWVEVLWGTKEVVGTGQCQAGIGTRLLLTCLSETGASPGKGELSVQLSMRSW